MRLGISSSWTHTSLEVVASAYATEPPHRMYIAEVEEILR